MDTIKIQQLDFRYILIENYKALGLSENELIVLLLIDNVEKEKPALITAEQLALKMNITEKEIDELLVGLLKKNFLSYDTIDNLMVITSKNTKNKIVEFVQKSFLLAPHNELLKNNDEEVASIYKEFETKMKRTLTSIEFEAIQSWLSEGVKKETILEALEECALKSKYVTIKAVDKIIIKNLTSKDRKKEGYSVIDEHNKKEIDEMIEIASYDWIHK